MSDLIKTPQIFNSRDCLALSSKVFNQKMKARDAIVGENIKIRRALPSRYTKKHIDWALAILH